MSAEPTLRLPISDRSGEPATWAATQTAER
jgi:hypothetical protein